MPNIKTAKKRVLINKKKAAHNKAINTNLKTEIKKANIALMENAEDRQVVVMNTVKKIDQACSKGLMHKNKAARKKSQLVKKLNASN